MKYIKSHVSTLYEYPCSSSTDCYPLNISLDKGVYSLEVWGASGGALTDEFSAPGGYSYGEIHIPSKTKIFIFLGGKGIVTTIDGPTDPAYNGGGRGSKHSRHEYDSSGGGATDIRVNNISLYHRVIVAGGGGGSGHDFDDSMGGAGGGESGLDGSKGCSDDSPTVCGSGGTGGEQKGDTQRFGLGQDHEGGDYHAGGGGGGWFGGFAGQSYGAGGGGGSGFVYREQNDLVQVPITFRLRNAFTKAGNETCPSPFDDSQIPGRLGHGVARITTLVPLCTKHHNHMPKKFFFLYEI